MKNYSSPKCVASLAMRLAFSLSLLLLGVNHFQNIQGYKAMVSGQLGPLTMLGDIWAYVLPALIIAGGALLAVNMYTTIAAWLVGIALGSIPVGLMLKTVLGGATSMEVMPMVINTFIWLIVFKFVAKSASCCGSSCTTNCDKKM